MLIFFFELLTPQDQRFIELTLLSLRFLHAFRILAQSFLQRLIASVKRSQTLAERPRLCLLLHCRREILSRQRQRTLRQLSQLLTKLSHARCLGNKLIFIAIQLRKMRPPAGNFLSPLTETIVFG